MLSRAAHIGGTDTVMQSQAAWQEKRREGHRTIVNSALVKVYITFGTFPSSLAKLAVQ